MQSYHHLAADRVFQMPHEPADGQRDHHAGTILWAALLVQCYLYNTASFVVCGVYSVKN